MGDALRRANDGRADQIHRDGAGVSAPLRNPVGDGLPEPTIRTATLADLDALVALEHAAFATDRAERRAIRHAILSPTMDVLAALIEALDDEPGPLLVGAAVLERRAAAGSPGSPRSRWRQIGAASGSAASFSTPPRRKPASTAATAFGWRCGPTTAPASASISAGATAASPCGPTITRTGWRRGATSEGCSARGTPPGAPAGSPGARLHRATRDPAERIRCRRPSVIAPLAATGLPTGRPDPGSGQPALHRSAVASRMCHTAARNTASNSSFHYSVHNLFFDNYKI